MTIKTKLTLNILMVVLAIAAVSVTSFIGMRFVKGKLVYLTERSTPFQMRTEQFQKSIQGATAELIKVATSRSRGEFESSRATAQKAIQEVNQLQGKLEELSGDQTIETYSELKKISDELLAITDSRLKSEEAGGAAYKAITDKLGETDSRLKALDRKIKSLQVSRSGAYLTAVKETDKINSRLQSIETLKTNLTRMLLICHEIQRSKNPKAQQNLANKITGLTRNILQNGNVREIKSLKAAADLLSVKTEEFIKVVTAGGSPEVIQKLVEEIDEQVNEATSSLQEVSEEVDESHDKLYARQGVLLDHSNLAASVLSLNSDMVALGTALEGLSAGLFIANSANDTEAKKKEILNIFAQIDRVQRALEADLRKLNASQEIQILRNAYSILGTVKSTLFSQGGVVETIAHLQDTQKEAAQGMANLQAIVQKQAVKGRETVTIAQGDQEKAISSVNKMVNTSMSLIAILGICAIVFGTVFGFWVYRTIATSLQRLQEISSKVAGGDLSTDIDTRNTDEIGRVQSAMADMVSNLRGMVGKIIEATSRLASSSEELSTTATTLKKGSDTQNDKINESATAMMEMSQSTLEIARNASEASDAADKMKGAAGQGKQAMRLSVQELEKFAALVKEAVATVESLGKQSEEISNIVKIISDIADQTNLLALNAAIEAARAGDQGRGFAVVADNVRSLAERTTVATQEISGTVRTMQGSVANSVVFMKQERESIENVLQQVDQTLNSIDSIAVYVENVTDMVQKTAVAAEEQSAGVEDISNNMEHITSIAKELKNSFEDINNSSADLSRLAGELNTMVGWFKV